MQTLDALLREHPFFEGMSPEYLRLIAGCGMNTQFRPGEYLLREGEDAQRFYLIRYGRVVLETHAAQQGAITIETIEPGEVLGWSWLFPPYRWHFSARAVEQVRAVSLDGVCLRTKCEADHDLGYELMKRFAAVMMQRLQATRLQMLDVYAAHERGVLR